MTGERLKQLLTDELRRNLLQGGRPRVPAGGDLLWRWFVDLSRARTYHAGGPNPISFAEVRAYAELYRWPMGPHHIDVLFALDRVYLDVSYEQAQVTRDGKTADGVKVLPPRSQHNVTPGMFDAMFG
ncbi:MULTISPECIES: phage tail assembly chaperone [unclassified Rhizobium]|uniref:phage tail assembly chaperone n=1 Tax=unclassified Rhizobium TaxID=2613769 RepID=UPI0025E2ABE4|nr:hypothetical protein [Rhizobium sp. UBA1881]